MAGYGCNLADLFVEPLEERHQCLDCHSVLRDAVQTEKGDRLCRSCCTRLFSNGRDRLVHGSTIDVALQCRSKTCYPDRAIQNEVDQLLVRCVFHNRGCSWRGELQHLNGHCCDCPCQLSSEVLPEKKHRQVREDRFQLNGSTRDKYRSTTCSLGVKGSPMWNNTSSWELDDMEMPSASPPPPRITDNPMLPALVFLRAIQQYWKPAYFVLEGMEILGRALNPVISHLHRAHWAKEVKFKTRTVVYKSDDDNTMLTEWKTVPDPSIGMRCPEAFSGESVLEHMKQPENLQHYARFIQYTAPEDLHDDIEGILQNHPKVYYPLNPEKALDVLAKMCSFLEGVEAGLYRNNEAAIGERITPLTNNLQELFRVAQFFLNQPLPLPI